MAQTIPEPDIMPEQVRRLEPMSSADPRGVTPSGATIDSRPTVEGLVAPPMYAGTVYLSNTSVMGGASETANEIGGVATGHLEDYNPPPQ